MPSTIMIVDDEPDVRDCISTLLVKNGFETIIAKNADDCMKQLTTKEPSVIIMDIMMPGTPVEKIISSIKKPKIIYLSALALAEAEKKKLLKPRNITEFMEKPFEIHDLLENVNKALK